MPKKIFLHALLLVSSFTLFGQENTWAMENDAPPAEYKRTATEAQLTPQDQPPKGQSIETAPSQSKTYYLDDVPIEVVRAEIIGPMDVEKDRIVLFAFMRTCEKFKAFVLQKYTLVNLAQRHFPWEDHPDFYATTVYFMGCRMRTLLGLSMNLEADIGNGRGQVADSRRFKKKLGVFLNHDVFPKGTLINAYIIFLRKYEEFVASLQQIEILPVPDETRNLKDRLQNQLFSDEARTLSDRFDKSAKDFVADTNPQRRRVQNELALYFHFMRIFPRVHSTSLILLRSQPIYTQNTCSLMDVLNPKLLTLKATPHLKMRPYHLSFKNHQYYADIWISIIDLDPGVTITQLIAAATDCMRAHRFAQAAEYYDRGWEGLAEYDVTLVAVDFQRTAVAYFKAGNFPKAAEYCDKELKNLAQYGLRIPPKAFITAGSMHFRAGNFVKAAEYLEIALNMLMKQKRVVPANLYMSLITVFTRLGDAEKVAFYQNFLEESEKGMHFSE